MTTYKEIFGKPIKVVSSDPTDTGAEGQIWYNSTLGSFRSIIAAGTWSAGGNMNTARRLLSGLGTQTASLGFGGYIGPSTNASEEYNGTSWTNSPNYPSVIYGAGAIGTQTAGVGAGGYLQPTTSSVNTTQDYNGSSWGSGSGTLKAGDFIKFANHDKIYMVVADQSDISTGSLTIEPPLTTAVSSSNITYDNVPFTVHLTNDIQEFGVVGTANDGALLYQFEFDVEESL